MKTAARIIDEHTPLPALGMTASRPRLFGERLRHAGSVIATHWVSAGMMVLAAATVLVRELVEDRGWRVLLIDAHRQVGLAVLLLLGVRLWLRVRGRMADTTSDMHPLLKLAAHGAHSMLYGLLLAIPLLGWALTSAHEQTLRLFGLVTLPAIATADSDLADTLTDWHVLASWVMLAALVAHVAAALWHHFVRRDQVLSAMLPWTAERRPRQAVKLAASRANQSGIASR